MKNPAPKMWHPVSCWPSSKLTPLLGARLCVTLAPAKPQVRHTGCHMVPHFLIYKPYAHTQEEEYTKNVAPEDIGR